MSDEQADAISVEDEWRPATPPRDGVPRIYRVYGYRYTGRPRFPLGDSLGQRGIGTPDLDEALALRERLAEERPADRWVVEWTVAW